MHGRFETRSTATLLTANASRARRTSSPNSVEPGAAPFAFVTTGSGSQLHVRRDDVEDEHGVAFDVAGDDAVAAATHDSRAGGAVKDAGMPTDRLPVASPREGGPALSRIE